MLLMHIAPTDLTAQLLRDLRTVSTAKAGSLETVPWLLVVAIAYLREMHDAGDALKSVNARVLARCDNARDQWDHLLAAWLPELRRSYSSSSTVREQLLHDHAAPLFEAGLIARRDSEADEYEDEVIFTIASAFRQAARNVGLVPVRKEDVVSLGPAAWSADAYFKATLAAAREQEPHIAFAASAWPDQTATAVRGLLATPVNTFQVGVALRMGQALELRGLEDAAVAVLRKLDLNADNPYAAVQAADYLLWSGCFVDEAVDAVRRCAAARHIRGYRGNPQRDAYAILALTYRDAFTPSELLSFIHEAQHDSPRNRDEMATILAWIGRPWALPELRTAVANKSDPVQIVLAAERAVRGERLGAMPDKAHPGPDGDAGPWGPAQRAWNDDRLLDARMDHIRPVLERITDLSDPRECARAEAPHEAEQSR
jgi:hypothetical protein